MKDAYSYIRMSTHTQLKGDSLRRQLEKSKEYADKHGLNLVENLQDIGVSAYRGDNVDFGALGLFHELVKSKKVEPGSYLLVESLDRLSRDKITKSLPRFMDLLNDGIIIVTLQDNQIYSEASFNDDQSQLFISLGVMLRAHDESSHKSFRIASVWDKKRKDASQKILTSRCPSWLVPKSDKSGFEIRPDAARAIQSIFDWCLKGDGTLVITRRLNIQKVTPIGRSKEWNLSYVKKILKNPSVTGVFQPCKLENGKQVPTGPIIENYYPTVISEPDFLSAQKIISSRKGKGGRKGKVFSNLFSHLAKCGSCGSSLAYMDKGIRSKPHLICTSSHQKSGCNAFSINYLDFETAILNSIDTIDLTHLFSDEQKNYENELKDRLTLKNNELEKLRAQHSQNMEAWLTLSEQLKTGMTKKLEQENSFLNSLESNCSELEAELDRIRMCPSSYKLGQSAA